MTPGTGGPTIVTQGALTVTDEVLANGDLVTGVDPNAAGSWCAADNLPFGTEDSVPDK